MSRLPQLFVIHGGPGLTVDYMLRSLQPLQSDRRITPIPQIDTVRGADAPDDMHSAVDHLQTAIEKHAGGEPCGIIAHSFGTILTLALLARQPSCKINELIVCNPFPLTAARFQEALQRMRLMLDERLTPAQLTRLAELQRRTDSASNNELIQLITPIYVGDPADAPKLHFGPYNRGYAQAVQQSIPNLDARPWLRHLPTRTLVLLGERDFFTTDGARELIDAATESATIPGAGHSPFLETPARFIEIVQRFFSGDKRR